jgi:hypothetical protein
MAAIPKLEDQQLLVRIVRESGLEWFQLILPDNSSDDVEATEALEWFRQHHVGKMDVQLIERALDDAWNFGEANVIIVNPRFPTREESRTAPKI